MKQGLFFVVGSAVGNLINCRVPDGNPTNIPEDCQVCQDDIIIEHDMWPIKPLALKQIAGRLIVKANRPDQFKIPIHVETLELAGDLPNNLDLGLVQAEALHVNKVLGFPTITFNGLNPRFIFIEKSYVELKGIISDHISKLEITSSSLKDTTFDMKAAENISISQTTMNGMKIFPTLREVHSLNINFSTMDKLAIPLVKATGDISIFFNKKLAVVNFLDLEKVQGTFGVRGFEIQVINIPTLKEAHALEMNTKLVAINMSGDLSWPGESTFHSENFCNDYSSTFQHHNFKSKIPCQPLCESKVVLNSRNLNEFQRCTTAQDLILDGSFLHTSVELPALRELLGALEFRSFRKTVHFPLLRKLGGSLGITGNSDVPVSTFTNLEVASLNISDTVNLDILEFNHLRIANNIVISGTTLEMVSGISSKKLQGITISNNAKLWELLLPNLSSAETVSITKNPNLLYLEKTFPNLGRIEKSLQVEGSNIVNLKLPAVEKSEASLVISNNPQLARIEMPFLMQGSMAITSSGNPMYTSFITASGEKVVGITFPPRR